MRWYRFFQLLPLYLSPLILEREALPSLNISSPVSMEIGRRRWRLAGNFIFSGEVVRFPATTKSTQKFTIHISNFLFFYTKHVSGLGFFKNNSNSSRSTCFGTAWNLFYISLEFSNETSWNFSRFTLILFLQWFSKRKQEVSGFTCFVVSVDDDFSENSWLEPVQFFTCLLSSFSLTRSFVISARFCCFWQRIRASNCEGERDSKMMIQRISENLQKKSLWIFFDSKSLVNLLWWFCGLDLLICLNWFWSWWWFGSNLLILVESENG